MDKRGKAGMDKRGQAGIDERDPRKQKARPVQTQNSARPAKKPPNNAGIYE